MGIDDPHLFPMTLPRDETAFFGRNDELADVERRLQSDARLVTLVGLGGIGKTRVALEVGSRRPKGKVTFVRLREARGLEAAVREIAHAAGVRVAAELRAAAGVKAIGEALAKRGAMLLVVDGIEPLGALGGELATGLLDQARELRVLATSREPLGVRGEEKVLLAPLGAEEASALFLDRARVAAGAPVDVDAADVAAIVKRVDAVPLAIELAAARMEVLSAKEVLARLGTAQVSMRATLDGSWDLLSAEERSVLAQASVFAAPFGIDAAEEVLVVPPGKNVEVLDVVEALLRKSILVRADAASGPARVRMYETVRAWAKEKLATMPETQEVRARHAAYHLAQAEAWAAQSYGSEGVRALDALTELLPELLVAFEKSGPAEPQTRARTALALTDLLLFRGLFELRAEVFATGVVAAEQAGDDRLTARALVANARVTLEVGRMADAEKELLRALALAEKAGDEATIAEATRSLAWLFTATSRVDDAEAALTKALAMHREQGSARGEADAHVATGILRAFQGKRDEALERLQTALGIHVESGDVIRQEKVLGFGALIGLAADDVARGLPREVLARAPASTLALLPSHVAELVQAQHDLGTQWRQAIDLYVRGSTVHENNAPVEAVAIFEKALAALSRAGVTRGVATIVAHTAVALAESGDFKEADARIARAKTAATEPGTGRVVEVFAAAVDAYRTAKGGAHDAALSAGREILARAREADGAPPELAIARRILARALAGSPNRADGGASNVGLVVGQESRWIVPKGGEKIDLVRYGPVRRLLDRLVVHRFEAQGQALSAEALIEAGWPGERMRHTAGLLRVYSAIRRLRRLGLEGILVTRDDGYLLDPETPVTRSDT